MTDIVERLRCHSLVDVYDLCREAADEIENWRKIAALREERLSMAAEIMRRRSDEMDRLRDDNAQIKKRYMEMTEAAHILRCKADGVDPHAPPDAPANSSGIRPSPPEAYRILGIKP